MHPGGEQVHYPDQLVQEVAENTGTAIATPTHVRLARYISIILAPATISIPMVVLVAIYHSNNPTSSLLYVALTLFFLSCGPLAYILLGVRSGRLSDVDVSRRTERSGPFLFSIASMMLGFFVLGALHGPKNLETVLLGTALTALGLMVTTYWWKISVHATSVAGAVTVLVVLYGAPMLPVILVSGLVSWSRVVLGRHTIAQVVAGSLVGMVLTSVLFLVRGL
jgi:membrane-associated phospholipid phosphatase